MAIHYSTSDLRAMGWTTGLIHSLLGNPDEKEDISRGAYRCQRHFYAKDRVEAAMLLPAWSVATQRRDERMRRPALRMEGFQRKYQTWRAAVPDACNALHSLNRYAKHRTCSPANKVEIYGLKNLFVEVLYRGGFCTACWEHILVLPAKECRACRGTDPDCDRCDGCGIYLAEKRLKFYCFRIALGRGYTWHQPDNLVKFPVETTREPADWSGVERDKPLGMPRSALGAAKDLVRWVVDQARVAPGEARVEFSETIAPIVETEQGSLFA